MSAPYPSDDLAKPMVWHWVPTLKFKSVRFEPNLSGCHRIAVAITIMVLWTHWLHWLLLHCVAMIILHFSILDEFPPGESSKEECWKVSAKPRDRESLPTNDFWAALEKVWPGLHFGDKSFCIELELSTRDRSQHDSSQIICLYHRDSDPRRVPLLFPENLRDYNFWTRIYPPFCTARVRYAYLCD